MAPNEMLVPHETLDKEFLSLADAEGLADIEHLNKVLDRAVNLKNFLKGKARIPKVAEFVAKHYKENVEPLGYKAFLVGVDREACALYKHALDQFLPPEYSEVVYTGNNNDSALLKEFHTEDKKEPRSARPSPKLDKFPKILHRHREAPHRFRRARPLRHVPGQAHARPHPHSNRTITTDPQKW